MTVQDHQVNSPMTYAAAGVDVDVEAKASRIMYEASRKTYENRKGKIGEIFQLFDDFSGLKVFSVGALPTNTVASLGLDGAGTKTEIPCRVKSYTSIARDLIAMVADDAVIRGGEPALVGSVLDIKSLGRDERYLGVIKDLAKGYVFAAEEAGVAIINGEIAQMGALVSGYGDFPFNWSAACIWFAKRDRLMSGSEVRPGQAVVVFEEKGFRCNGLSLVRRVYENAFGPMWHEKRIDWEDHFTYSLGDKVLTSSTIYTRLMVDLHGGYDGKPRCRIFGAAHITGGGVPEKLGRMLKPSDLGVHLHNLSEPGECLRHLQHVGRIPDFEAYKTLNMGQGMAVVTDEPDVVIERARLFGVRAQVAGYIRAERGISLVSKGYLNRGSVLEY